MTERKALAEELEKIAAYFDERRHDCKGAEAQNVHYFRAALIRSAAAVILSDQETIREYEEFVDGLEDDGK